MRPVDVKSRLYIAFEKKNNKFLNLRLDTIQEYQNIKKNFQRLHFKLF